MERRREIMVGFVVVLGIAVAVTGSMWLKGGFNRGQAQLRTASTSVGALVPGAVVKFRGVTVGRVEDIEVLPSGEAVMIDMRVRAELVIPDNAGVLLAPESMFGEWQAEILDRTEFALPTFLDYPEEGVLPGAAITDFSRLTTTLDQIARNLSTISDRVEVAFTEETALNLKGVIDNMRGVSDLLSEIIEQQADRFETLADGVDDSAHELGDAAHAARLAFERFDSLMTGAGVEEMLADAGASLRSLRDITGDVGTTMTDLRTAAQRVDATFARMETMLASLEDPEGSVGRLLGDPALAEGALGALADFRALLADFQRDPGRYIRISVFE